MSSITTDDIVKNYNSLLHPAKSHWKIKTLFEMKKEYGIELIYQTHADSYDKEMVNNILLMLPYLIFGLAETFLALEIVIYLNVILIILIVIYSFLFIRKVVSNFFTLSRKKVIRYNSWSFGAWALLYRNDKHKYNGREWMVTWESFVRDFKVKHRCTWPNILEIRFAEAGKQMTWTYRWMAYVYGMYCINATYATKSLKLKKKRPLLFHIFLWNFLATIFCLIVPVLLGSFSVWIWLLDPEPIYIGSVLIDSDFSDIPGYSLFPPLAIAAISIWVVWILGTFIFRMFIALSYPSVIKKAYDIFPKEVVRDLKSFPDSGNLLTRYSIYSKAEKSPTSISSAEW